MINKDFVQRFQKFWKNSKKIGTKKLKVFKQPTNKEYFKKRQRSWEQMYQAINYLKTIPEERVLQDAELRAIYYELKAIFEKPHY